MQYSSALAIKYMLKKWSTKVHSASRDRCRSSIFVSKEIFFDLFHFSVSYQTGDDVPDPLGILSLLYRTLRCHLVVCRSFSAQGNQCWCGGWIQPSELFQKSSSQTHRVIYQSSHLFGLEMILFSNFSGEVSVPKEEQFVVTPVHPGVKTRSSQMNDVNSDFANRSLFHQTQQHTVENSQFQRK